MTAVILAAAQPGRRHVVAVRPLYGGTDHLLRSSMLDAEVTFCAAAPVRSAVRADTCLVVLETPANPTLDLVDIVAVARAAGGWPVVVDNTFATPILQNPARRGADMVLHSATKYLGGHGDAVDGVVAANTSWAAALRRVRAMTGGILHPLAGYLLHRGLATLPIRSGPSRTPRESWPPGSAPTPASGRFTTRDCPNATRTGWYPSRCADPAQ